MKYVIRVTISAALAGLLISGCGGDKSVDPGAQSISQAESLIPNPPTVGAIAIPVNPGPPAMITIMDLSDAEIAGPIGCGAGIQCSFNIRVRDADGDFVAEGTQIIVIAEGAAIIQPPVILTNSFGIATGTVYYNSEATYTEIAITAQYEGPGLLVSETREGMKLPLLGGELYLEIVPTSIIFINPQVPNVFKCNPTLLDDLGHFINAMPISFSNSLDLFFCTDSAEAAGPLANNWNLSGNWTNITTSDVPLFLRVEYRTNFSVTPPYPGILPDSTLEVECFLPNTNITSYPANVTFRLPG